MEISLISIFQSIFLCTDLLTMLFYPDVFRYLSTANAIVATAKTETEIKCGKISINPLPLSNIIRITET